VGLGKGIVGWEGVRGYWWSGGLGRDFYEDADFRFYWEETSWYGCFVRYGVFIRLSLYVKRWGFYVDRDGEGRGGRSDAVIVARLSCSEVDC